MRRRDRDLAADRLAALLADPGRARPGPSGPEVVRPPSGAAEPLTVGSRDGAPEPETAGPTSDPVEGGQPDPRTPAPPEEHPSQPVATGERLGRSAGPVLALPATGWTPARTPAAAMTPPTATTAALDAAARGYTAAHPGLERTERRADHRRTRVRWSVTPRTAAAASVALLLLAGAVALRAARAAPGDPVLLPTPAATVESSTAPVHVSEVVVDVVGEVAAPGVVRLPAGSRVADAVAAAGGPTASAHLAAINLARVLVDGEQLVVPGPGDPPAPAGSSAPSAGAPALVDLNTADAAALDTLPGVGPVLAQRILDARATRPFSSVDELADVPGIGPALLARLRPLVRT